MTGLPVWAYVVWAVSLVGGVAIGRFQERHKETVNMRNFANAYVAWYERRAPVLVSAVALLALLGIWMATAATITNGRQDAAAQVANEKVQACFDQYAQAQSASSKAVREASEEKDKATAIRDDALNDEGRAFKSLVRKILTGNVTDADVKLLADTLTARDQAGKRLDRAQAALDRARAENPVPSAPSEFCSVKP